MRLSWFLEQSRNIDEMVTSSTPIEGLTAKGLTFEGLTRVRMLPFNGLTGDV